MFRVRFPYSPSVNSVLDRSGLPVLVNHSTSNCFSFFGWNWVTFQCMPKLKQLLRLPIPLLDKPYQSHLLALELRRQVMTQDSFGF